jgi:1,2-diacylglycerol 3-alpha-glucosyltransferase
MEERKITVGQFNDTFVPIMDGVGLVARNYAYWINKKYGAAFAVVPRVPGYEDTEDFPVLRFKSLPIPGRAPWRLGIPKFDIALKKKLDSMGLDLVHTHCPFTSGEYALAWAREKGIPVVTTFHSKYQEDFEKNFNFSPAVTWAMNKIMRFYNSVDFVWAPNEGAKQTLEGYGFEGKIEIIPNGTDLAAPDSRELEAYRNRGEERIGCRGSDFVFLFVGQLRWIKNIRLILESAKDLEERGRPFTLVFVGIGPDEEEIRGEIKKMGFEKRVRFMGRIIDREDMKSFYARADVFLFPSLYDTSSLVVREAAAFSTPSVFVSGASTAEGIIDGKNGFIAENDARSYAAVLDKLMGDARLIKRAGRGARSSLYRTWEEVVDQVYAGYIEILDTFSKGDS